MTINMPLYLKGLWAACEGLGAKYSERKIHSLEEIDSYDGVILATGSLSRSINELSALPLRNIKGQILEISWPSGLAPLPYSINSQAYVVMRDSNQSCIVGATFERSFENEEPQIEIAKHLLLPKLLKLLPQIAFEPVLGCYAGVRATTPTRLPMLEKMSDKCWIYAGLGSKGLLYHALFARRLVDSIL